MKEHVGKELKIVKPKNMLRLLNRNHLRWYTRVAGRRVVSASYQASATGTRLVAGVARC